MSEVREAVRKMKMSELALKLQFEQQEHEKCMAQTRHPNKAKQLQIKVAFWF